MPNVHKDFHGTLSLGLDFLQKNYGAEGTREFLTGLAETVYAPLVEEIKKRGLDALREHWENIFSLEEGEIALRIEDNVLILEVHKCPALHHIKEHGYTTSSNFCEHTRITNEGICHAAGYECSVEYDQDRGRCVQRFWRVG
ncbi:MAG TPA: hypothetical protein PLQ35_06430 [bacterium]|nr:hypothetical protein [bacterium]HQL61912.1 hypothetical protein [bacterium]